MARTRRDRWLPEVTRPQRIPPRGHAQAPPGAAPGSALADLEVAEHTDADAEPGIGGGEESVVLWLWPDRREPELVDGGVGDAAVQPSPDAVPLRPERRRRDRVGPLDRVATLVEGPPGRGGLRLADRTEAAL